MKILEENKKQGEITVKVENINDLWTLFNVISKNDKVTSLTQRRVIIREGTKGERKLMRLKIKVENVDFHEFSNRLRIKGTILEGPEDFVSFGTYHTLNIEVGQTLTIQKDKWFSHELKRLTQSSKFESNFITLIIAIETGLATIEIITNFSQTRIATIKKTIPGKRYEQKDRNKALNEFFNDIKKVIEENMKNFDINLIVICGPGNTRDLFIKYLKEKGNVSYISKIRSLHASSGTESGVLEVLKSKKLAALKKKIKVLEEAEKIDEIFRLFSKDPDMIVIGFNEIIPAAKKGAIKELFLVDLLIRASSRKDKLIIEEIITNVENSGGKVNILSSEHPTGKQIIDLGSIVGILRYKTN
ncbi:MAG: mRNA surveillance protein pelota [Promethearchaeota archaeon]